jgi:hypothetical protein
MFFCQVKYLGFRNPSVKGAKTHRFRGQAIHPERFSGASFVLLNGCVRLLTVRIDDGIYNDSC